MVSFSCEVCNDTVIKKKLDQHTRQCRGAYFTCIDCSTTFSGYDYRNHTQCISEAEKYEKSLYKGNNKKQKQQPVVQKKVEAAAPVIEKKPVKKEKKEKKSDDLSKYFKEDESMYKIIKKISKDNKKSTKDILKGFKIVKDGENYVIKL